MYESDSMSVDNSEVNSNRRSSIISSSSNIEGGLNKEFDKYASSENLLDVEQLRLNANVDDDEFAKGSNVIAEQILHSLRCKDEIIAQLTKELEQYRKKDNTTNKVVESWQSKFKRLECKCNKLAKELSEKERKHEKEKNQLEMELTELEKARVECDLQYQEMIDKLNAKLHLVESNQQEQVATMEREREYYKGEIEQLRMLLKIKENNKEHKTAEYNGENNRSSNNVIDYNVSYEMIHNDLVAQENACVKLESEVFALRSHVSQQLASFAELTLHNQELECKLEELKTNCNILQSQVQVLTTEKDVLTKEIKAVKREKEDLEEKLHNDMQNTWEDRELTQCVEQREHESQQQHEEEEGEEHAMLLESKESSKPYQHDKVEYMEKLQHHVEDSHRIERLVLASEQKRTDAEKHVAALTNENEQLQNELRAQRVCFRNEMLEQQTMCNALVKQWQDKLEESVRSLQEVSRQNTVVQNELHDLKRVYDDTCIELKNTQNKLEEVANRESNMQAEVKELEETINVLEEKLSVELGHSADLQKHVNELTAEQQSRCIALQHMERNLRNSKAAIHSFLSSLHVAVTPLQNLLNHKNAYQMSASLAVTSEEELLHANHHKLPNNSNSTSDSSSSEENNCVEESTTSEDSNVGNNNELAWYNVNHNNNNNNNSNNINAKKSNDVEIIVTCKETLKWIRKLVQRAKNELTNKENKMIEMKSKLSSLQASHKRTMMNEAQIVNSKINKMHNDHVEEMAKLEKRYKELSIQLASYKKDFECHMEEEQRTARRKQIECAEWKKRQERELREWITTKCQIMSNNLVMCVKEIMKFIRQYKAIRVTEANSTVAQTDKMIEWQVSNCIASECDEITQSILGLEGGWKELSSLIAQQDAKYETNHEKVNNSSTAITTSKLGDSEYNNLRESIDQILRDVFDIVANKSNNSVSTVKRITNDNSMLANILIQFIEANSKETCQRHRGYLL